MTDTVYEIRYSDRVVVETRSVEIAARESRAGYPVHASTEGR